MSTTDGMMYPTTKAMVGSNPADSARISMVNKAQSQTTANKLMAGGKIRRRARYGGAASTSSSISSITVPQYQMPYEPQGGTGTNPNNQIQGNSQTSTQMAANSVYDSDANKMGGSKCKGRKISSTFSKSRKGGNPDWIWGCMSGGKKRSRRGRRSSRRRNKHKKTRKNRRH